MQTTLMSEGVGYLYFNHDRGKERLIKGLSKKPEQENKFD